MVRDVNFALLIKLENRSEKNTEELIEQLKDAIRLNKPISHTETGFYLSANDSQEFFVLFFCFTASHIATFLKNLESCLRGCEPVEQSVFRLNWDYRLVHLQPTASHLRLTTFPDDYPALKINDSLGYSKHHLREVPNVIGAWLGLSLEGKTKVLSRIDWNSHTALMEYVGSQTLREVKTRQRGEKVQAEYASFNFRGNV
jgi:hypothetical protein